MSNTISGANPGDGAYNTLNAAITLADQGISTIPIPNLEEKRPNISWSEYQSRVPTSSEISSWYPDTSSIALVCGEVQALDLDICEDGDGSHLETFENLCYAAGMGDVLGDLVKQRSPSGGCHYFFRCPEEPIRNLKLAYTAKHEIKIETRGAGGYILISPSPGYEIEKGDIFDIPEISQNDRTELVSIAQSLDESPRKPQQVPTNHRISSPLPDTTRPGDAYNEDYDAFFTLLQSHGWVPVNGTRYWRRPGKTRGVSATWNTLSDCPNSFFVFSSNAHPLEGDRLYKPFAVYCEYEHGGDFTAAASSLSKQGYGDQGQLPSKDTKGKKPEAVGAPPFIDLTPYLSGDLEQEKPTVGEIEGEGYLFYAGRMNEIHGEPGEGKSNIGIITAADEISKGGTVVYLDPEDTPRNISYRLLAFGADPEDVHQRFKYLHNPEPQDIEATICWAKESEPVLVVADGLAELLAAQGLSENEPGDILPFYRTYLRPFADAGAAVVISDHVAKDSNGRGRWARGSGAKLGRYDGVSYELKTDQRYSPDQAGKVRLVVAKDRCGGVGPVGMVAAEVHFTPSGDNRTQVIIRPPDSTPFKPTALMEKVSRAIEANPDVSHRDLRSLGKAGYVDQAITALVDTGYLRVTQPGLGKKNTYLLISQYRQKT